MVSQIRQSSHWFLQNFHQESLDPPPPLVPTQIQIIRATNPVLVCPATVHPGCHGDSTSSGSDGSSRARNGSGSEAARSCSQPHGNQNQADVCWMKTSSWSSTRTLRGSAHQQTHQAPSTQMLTERGNDNGMETHLEEGGGGGGGASVSPLCSSEQMKSVWRRR